MKKYIMFYIFLYMLCFLLVPGCSTQKDIIRENDVEIKIPVPPVDIEIPAKPVNIDSAVLGGFFSGITDTSYFEAEGKTENAVIKARFYPKKKNPLTNTIGVLGLKVQTDTAITIYKDVDTTHQVIVKESASVKEYLIIVAGIILLIGVIMVVLKIKK